ncbi:MAG: hypothetical protein JSS32_06000 [Verrucomicrobia bacterium]|nr:hypothetical protein [Verrucomicrobiota bacterium]
MAIEASNQARDCLATTVATGCGCLMMLAAGKIVQSMPGASLAGSVFARSACVFLAGTAALGRQVVVHIEEAREAADVVLIRDALQTIRALFFSTVVSMVLQRDDPASLAVLAGTLILTAEGYLQLKRLDRRE